MADWPGTYERIVLAVGHPAAIKMVAQYGGTPLYLPMSIPKDHALAQLIGHDKASDLVEEFGYGSLIIPLGVEETYSKKRRQIAALLQNEQSHSAIAHDLKVHVRTVERVAARLRNPSSDTRQSSLFD